MKALLVLMLLQAAPQDASVYEDARREIQWARTFEAAFREARLRNIPVFVFLTSDN